MRLAARLTTPWLALALLCSSAHADDMRTRLQGAVDAVRQRLGLHGVTASVVTPSGSWTLASGISYVGVPMRPDHVLAIGSNSKTFAAILLLRFQEHGLLNLDTPIGRFLPPLTHVDTSITVRQLLQHTSGLGDYSATQAYRDSTLARATRLWTTSDLVKFIPAPQFAPGTSWSYCNTNYLLAGMIAQQVGGASLPVLVRNEITVPLGLDSTRYVPQELVLGTLAHRWINGQDISARPMTAEWSGAWAAGAIVSTARRDDGTVRGAVQWSPAVERLVEPDAPVHRARRLRARHQSQGRGRTDGDRSHRRHPGLHLRGDAGAGALRECGRARQ
jgi:D-alanyl-D-alanine carboxypeptidase